MWLDYALCTASAVSTTGEVVPLEVESAGFPWDEIVPRSAGLQIPMLKRSVKDDELKDWKEFLQDKLPKQSVSDFLDEKLYRPLGDLSFDGDDWLTIGDPADVVYMLIEDNAELRRFYEQTLCHPIEDELRVAKKIRQLNFSLEENKVKKPILKKWINIGKFEFLHDPVVDDPRRAALAELEELLRELRDRYTNNQQVHDLEGGNQEGEVTGIDWWADVFEDVENLRNLHGGSASTRSSSEPKGFAARLSYWARKTFFRPYRKSDEALYAEAERDIKITHRLTDHYDSSDLDGILARLRTDVNGALAESSGADAKGCDRFHSCFEKAVRERYRLVHKLGWDVTADLELMKTYLDLPVHTPWLTNYILATVLDRQILETRSDLKSIKRQGLTDLAVFLGSVIVIYLLFAFGLAWLAWPAVAFLIWRVCQEWRLFTLLGAVGNRAGVLESARTEIVSGCYDAEEISRRLQRKELTLAFPSLVYPLLRLGSKAGCQSA